MQTIYIDISNKSVLPTIYAKQGDVGRKFRIVFTESGVTYNIPDNAVFSVWYSGDSGEGNYTEVGDRQAIIVNKNEVIVELITQMLTNPGGGTLCLVLFSSDGDQIGTWNIQYTVEAVPGLDSPKAEDYYTALSEVATEATKSAVIAKQTMEYVDSKFKGKAGLIYPLATNEIPEGFLLCDGAEYSRTEYAELFDAIGTVYGDGDGNTTFNVPNLQTRVPVGAGENYDLGKTGGEAEHTLTVEQMPSHYHEEKIGVYGYSGWPEKTAKRTTAALKYGSDNYFNTDKETNLTEVLSNATTTSTGGNQPHSIMQPYTVVNYIISTGKEVEFVVGGMIGGGGSVELDTTLTKEGMAADAKAVGDRIGDIDSALDSIIAIQNELIGGESA